MKTDLNPGSTATLEQLLRREDVWRGHSRRFTPQVTLDTGYSRLNAALLHKGWPLGRLIEVCQPSLCGNSEWQLMAPALLNAAQGYVLLLNPPALPFAQGLLQIGLSLERLLVVQVENKADFIASFVELARAEACTAILAWQPKQALTYTELRKCLLATADGRALSVLFRPSSAELQSSPASLRLAVELQPQDLRVRIFKQKGLLQKSPLGALSLPLPAAWTGLLPHARLDEAAGPAPSGALYPRDTP